MDTVKFSIIIFFVNNDKMFVFEMNKTVSFSVFSNKNQQNESESIFQSPTIQDLRVDHNLEEPISAESLTLLVNEEVAIVQNRLHNISYNLEYAISGDGPLTTFAFIARAAFIDTKYANAFDDCPDIQLHFTSSDVISDASRKIFALTREFYDPVCICRASG